MNLLQIKVPANDIRQAATLLDSYISATPMISALSISKFFGCLLHLKIENPKYTSSLKLRDAAFAMTHLTDKQKQPGVFTMQAGYHAQAVAFRSYQEGAKATIVMPKRTPFYKVERPRSYGADIILTGGRLNECEAKLEGYQGGGYIGHCSFIPMIIPM